MKKLRVIHFGDLHVWRMGFEWSDPFYLKRYTGYMNLLLKRRKKFPPEIGKQVIEHILKQDADLVVFSGDLTTASNRGEFEDAAKLFQPLYEKWGDRFFIIPGNHDRYTNKSVREDWYAQAFPYGAIDGVRAQEIDESTVVVGIDASIAFSLRSNGYYSDLLDCQLRRELDKHRDKRVILVGHYPVEYPEHIHPSWEHVLLGREKLAEVLDEYKPAVYLHGHKHVRWKLGNALNCGSAGMVSSEPTKHAGYLAFELTDQLESVQSYYVNDLNKIVSDSLS